MVVGRDGRAKAYRPLPDAERAAALADGLAAYERGDFFEAHELLEPAWMGTPDLPERALLQGIIKIAAAYVHDVRGNPAGIVRNLTGARALLDEARTTGPGGQRRRAGPDGAHRRHRRRGWPTSPTTRPGRPSAHPTCEGASHEHARARSRPSTSTRPTDACARTPTRRSCSTSGRWASSSTVRAPGAALVPTSMFMTRVDELPADRPLLVVCHVGGRSASVAGYLIRAGRTDVVNVAGGMDAWEKAGLPVRRGPLEPGEGDLPAGSTRSYLRRARCRMRPNSARVWALWANATPTRISRMKLMAPTVAALR